MKKLTIFLLLLFLIFGAVNFGEASTIRIHSMQNLSGIVEDDVVDTIRNPAQLFFVEEDKIVFDRTGIFLGSDDIDYRSNVRLSSNPHIMMRLDEQIAVGGEIDFNYAGTETVETSFSSKGRIAYQLNEDLVIGGLLGFDMYNVDYDYGDDSDRVMVFQTGFNYDVDAELTIDGSFGFNTFGGIDSDDNKIQLYARGIKDLTDWYNFVATADLRFADDDNYQIFKLGQNFDVYDSLLAYGFRIRNQEDYFNIRVRAGAEKEFTDKLTLRAGLWSQIFTMDERWERDRTEFTTPSLGNSRLGAEYRLNDQTSLDFRIGNNNLQIGSENDDSINELNINFGLNMKL